MTQHDLRGELASYIRQLMAPNTYVDCGVLPAELEQVYGHNSNRLP
jgi:hypothetical protein